MKFLGISDTHSLHNKIKKDFLPKADAIFHSGDFSMMGREEEVVDFLNWFSKLPYEFKIFCSGNHDKMAERNPSLFKSLIPKNVIYLEDSGIEIKGHKIWGSPMSPTFGYDWAFNRDRGKEIMKHWNKIPLDTEILLTHTPVNGIGQLDITEEGHIVGCESLLEKLPELKYLRYHQSAHIHEGRGTYRFADGQLFVNPSILNRSYHISNKPYLIDTEGYKIIDY